MKWFVICLAIFTLLGSYLVSSLPEISPGRKSIPRVPILVALSWKVFGVTLLLVNSIALIRPWDLSAACRHLVAVLLAIDVA